MKKLKLLIKGGQVVDTVKLAVSQADVLVENGVIVAIGDNLPTENVETICCGSTATPMPS